MDLTLVKFLLDENIPHKLINLFRLRGLKCSTLQGLNWSGIKNGDLARKIEEENYVLVTRDKDFVFLWRKYHIKVIYLAVEPSTLLFLLPRL